jgi:histidine triad (HIT) family protein
MSQHVSDPGCIFCKIVRGEIPASKIFETADATAFLDINPVNRGHILVVPKAHATSLAELSDECSAHIGMLLPRLCRAVRTATQADGFNVVVNGGKVAGQTIDHCHFHVIPRFDGDPVNWPWPHTGYQGDEMAEMQSRIGLELGPPDHNISES